MEKRITPVIARQAHDDLVYHQTSIATSAREFGVSYLKLRAAVVKLLKHPIRACTPNTKLEPKQVEEIHRMRELGYTQSRIADRVGTSQAQVCLVLSGKCHLAVSRTCATRDGEKVIDGEGWKPGVSPAAVKFIQELTGWNRHASKMALLQYCEQHGIHALKFIDDSNLEQVFEFCSRHTPPKRGRRPNVGDNQPVPAPDID